MRYSFFLYIVVFLVTCCAQETFHNTQVTSKLAMQSDTIVQSQIACYQDNKQKYRRISGVFFKDLLDFRTKVTTEGAVMHDKDHIAFSLHIPFPDLQGTVGQPYGGARLKQIDVILTIYLGDSDFLLVKDLADAKKITSLTHRRYYQLRFAVDNIPVMWHQWHTRARNSLLPFHFSIQELAEQNIWVIATDGRVLGSLYRLGQWHLATLALDFHFEYATIHFKPLVKRMASMDAKTVLKNKTSRELDQAFTAINAIFADKEPITSEANKLQIYALMTAVKNIAYYTQKLLGDQANPFDLFAQNMQELYQQVEQQKLTREQLTPALNELRKGLIRNFSAMYNNSQQKSKLQK